MNSMSYFEAWLYLRNRGFSEKELDTLTIPQVKRLAEDKATKKGTRGNK
jgi:hypothetical protein